MDASFARTHLYLTFVYDDKGMFEESIAELQKLLLLNGAPPERAAKDADALRAAYKAAGAKGYWQKKAELYVDYYNHGGDVPPSSVATFYAHAGDKERAFEWLEKAYRSRDAILLSIRGEPVFDDWRSDPRFQDLLRRIGFPQ